VGNVVGGDRIGLGHIEKFATVLLLDLQFVIKVAVVSILEVLVNAIHLSLLLIGIIYTKRVLCWLKVHFIMFVLTTILL